MDQELCFDVLEELSRDLFLMDYYDFLGINETTWDLTYDRTRFAEHCCILYDTLERRFWHSVIDVVCSIGDLDTLKWFHRHTLQRRGCDQREHKPEMFLNTDDHLFNAYLNHNLDIIMWLFKNGYIQYKWMVFDWVNGSAEYFEVIKYIYETYKHERVIEDWRFRNMLLGACASGNLDMIKWVFDNGFIKRDRTYSELAMDTGHPDVAEWLNDIFGFDKGSDGYFEYYDHLLERAPKRRKLNPKN